MSRADWAELHVERVRAIGELLHGLGPETQGAILADLLAMWLAGHFTDADATAKLREDLLAEHIKTVRQLIPCNEQEILKRHRARTN